MLGNPFCRSGYLIRQFVDTENDAVIIAITIIQTIHIEKSV